MEQWIPLRSQRTYNFFDEPKTYDDVFSKKKKKKTYDFDTGH